MKIIKQENDIITLEVEEIQLNVYLRCILDSANNMVKDANENGDTLLAGLWQKDVEIVEKLLDELTTI